MISQKTQLEVKVKDKNHTYDFPPNATLLECLEALNTFSSYIFGRIKDVEEQSRPQEVIPQEVVVQEQIQEEPQPQIEQVIDGNQQ